MSYFGILKGLISSTVARPIRVDSSTHTMQTIEYEHHEIHSGSHYFVDGVVDLAVNHVLDFTWQMEASTKWVHWTWELKAESQTIYQVYETVTANNPLANTVTPRNSNRNVADGSVTIMKFEDQATLAAANVDTDVTAATLIQEGIIGAGKDAGVEVRSHEIVMKQGALYCLRATASTAGYVNFTMQWYEHTDKN